MARRLLWACALLAMTATATSARSASARPEGAVLFSDVIEVLDFAVPVAAGQSVSVRFPVGELEVVADAVEGVRTELEIRCRKLSEALCAKYSRRLRLDAVERDGVVEVRLAGLPKWKLRKLQLDGVVTVPDWAPLAVHVGVGDVEIHAGRRDLGVRMGIGDLTIHVPQDRVRSVRAATGIGDASLHGAIQREGTRRRLLGARLDWAEGSGSVDIALGLRIGDARVVLE